MCRPLPCPIAPAGPSEAAAPRAGGDELAHLPVELLQRGKYQPRVDMRQEALEELAISIRNQGVIQPIVVRPLANAGRRCTALRNHRRRTSLARRADRGPQDHPRRHPPRGRRSRHRDGADREHPARGSQSAGRSARAGTAHRRVRRDACSRPPMQWVVHAPRSAICCGCWNSRPKWPRCWRSASSKWGMRARCCHSRSVASRWRLAQLVVRDGLSVRQTEALVRELLDPTLRKPVQSHRCCVAANRPQRECTAAGSGRAPGRQGIDSAGIWRQGQAGGQLQQSG